ncbi:type II secretion system F family protein [Sideroxydans lithotrophicus]|uniref:Type II secretion system F domain protein n=1 Tax=Sideroxydans lithotrophicus (strain ES-1) TaxID=580332 RepID=D5CND5_SIDLE|nr:type II secretion system F family protein [Sideroxydans lithotrophicus]ADE12832.1 Type II secretion system F domain protein [Sideroxydans lithotrophicus ES-1]
MPVFTYKGRSARGELVQGSLEGADSGVVADQLLNTGITPTEIKITTQAVRSGSNPEIGLWQRLTKENKVDVLELMLFSRQMYTLLKAGVPIMRALAGLQESSRNPVFSAMLQDLRESLDSGRELSTALRRHPKIFSPFYLSMVQVGEMTGMLDVTFLRLYEHLEFEKDMKERIKSAVRYPMFVLVAMAVAIVIVNIFVIPAFAKVFEGFHAQLPLMTRILMGFSGFMVHYWPILLAVLVGAVVAFRSWISSVDGRYKWDRYKFHIPIAGRIIMKATLARFARSLALSFKSGIPIVQGLNSVALVVDNEFMRSRVEQMRDGVERGESILRTATATGVFNPTVLQMIAVGEETGDMDGLMFEIAGMYEREVEYEIKTLSSNIEPIMIVLLGVLVLILALGIFLPMWDLGKAALHR